jgi:hypothetical protein
MALEAEKSLAAQQTRASKVKKVKKISSRWPMFDWGRSESKKCLFFCVGWLNMSVAMSTVYANTKQNITTSAHFAIATIAPASIVTASGDDRRWCHVTFSYHLPLLSLRQY